MAEASTVTRLRLQIVGALKARPAIPRAVLREFIENDSVEHNIRLSRCPTAVMVSAVVNRQANASPERCQKIAALLDEVGLENPFDVTHPRLTNFANAVLNNYEYFHQNNRLKQAFVLFCSLLHPSQAVSLSDGLQTSFSKINAPFEISGRPGAYRGMKESEGGLEIRYSENPNENIRLAEGNLLPYQLIEARREERVAVCGEFSALLISLLRIANLKAEYNLVDNESHANVVLTLPDPEGKDHYFLLDVARREFKRLKVKPSTVVADDVGFLKHYANEAFWLVNQGNTDRSITLFGISLHLGPENAVTLNNLGTALLQRNNPGDLQIALNCFDAAIGSARKQNRFYSSAVMNKVLVLIKIGEYEAAKELAHELLGHNPDNVYALCFRAEIGGWLGERKIMGRFFAEALQCNPYEVADYVHLKEEKKRGYYLWYVLGQAYALGNSKENAINALRKAVSLNRYHAASWYALGGAYWRNGRYADAILACVKGVFFGGGILGHKINPIEV